MSDFAPPLVAASALAQSLISQGYGVLSADALCELIGIERHALQSLAPSWSDLPPDLYLRDGGRYRRRRHACFIVSDGQVEQTAHRAHWQPIEYNALHGGLERWFEPIDPAVIWRRRLAAAAFGAGAGGVSRHRV